MMEISCIHSGVNSKENHLNVGLVEKRCTKVTPVFLVSPPYNKYSSTFRRHSTSSFKFQLIDSISIFYVVGS